MSDSKTEIFEKLFSEEPEYQFFAPGRVNLIGEHIDYSGGYVFPSAITYGTHALARRREDHIIRFYSLNFEDKGIIEVDLNDLKFAEKDGWTNYPKGVFKMILDDGYKLDTGMDILYEGNIPHGAGLSSSASIEVVTATLLNKAYNLNLSMLECVVISQRAENEFVGVNSGIMDQFAIGMGQMDKAILLNTNTLSYRYVPIKLKNISIVIMNTNKRRDLIDSAYNKRRKECDQGLQIIQKFYDVASICELTSEQLESIKNHFDGVIYKRVRHAVSENERTLEAVEVLEKNDIISFGMLMNKSHDSLRDDYEVTGIELDTLVDAARSVEGTIGARVTGAGFGGCAIALVKDDQIDTLIETVQETYSKQIGYDASFYVAQIGEGAHEINE